MLSNEQTRRLVEFARTVGSDALMAGFFVVTWFAPFAFGETAPKGCGAIFMMEFVAVHSTAMIMGFGGTRAGLLIALIYVPFIVGIGIQYEVLWPVAFFAFHVYGTVADLWSKDSVGQIGLLLKWLVSFGVLLGSIMVAAFIPWPDFGWNAVSAPELAASSNGTTIYHFIPAWGTLYFSVLTWLSYRAWKRGAAKPVSAA